MEVVVAWEMLVGFYKGGGMGEGTYDRHLFYVSILYLEIWMLGEIMAGTYCEELARGGLGLPSVALRLFLWVVIIVVVLMK